MIILSTICSENYPSFALFLTDLPSLTKKISLIVFYLSQFITTMELHHCLCQEVWRHLSEVQGITTSPQL